jgi:hypothetical protein
MKIIFLSILLILNSCSAFKKDKDVSVSNAKSVDVNIDLIATDMASLNYLIRPKLIRKEKIRDFSLMTSAFYRQKVSVYNDASEVDYVEFLTLKTTTLEVRGKDMNFAACVKNIDLKFILCDSAKTSFIDFVSKDLSVDMNEKINDLL